MTLQEFLQKLRLGNHALNARHPDGTKCEDSFMVVLDFWGHGDPLNAEIHQIILSGKTMMLDLIGDKQNKPETESGEEPERSA